MILFHLQGLGAERQKPVLQFLENKNLRSKSNVFFFQKIAFFANIFFVCCVFLLERDRIFKKGAYDGLIN